MKSGCRSCALAAASSSALGINHRKITHTSTSRWAMSVRSSAPIALRYSASIRAWARTKLIRQIVLTVMTELNCAASFVLPTAANQRQAPSSRSLGAVHDGHERSEFGRMQAALRPNQRIYGALDPMPTRAGLLDLGTPKLVNDLLRSSLALRFSSMLWPWQLWLRDTPEQKFAPAVPHTHQRGACILRSFFLAPCSFEMLMRAPA